MIAIPAVIAIPGAIRDAIASQATAELPDECCGYLGGRRDGDRRAVVSHYPMTNADHSPEHFSFDPAEQFAVLRQARNEDLDLVATYHSHPETPARMSEEDIRLANDTSAVYLIYSVSGRTLKAFTVDRERVVTEIPITFTD